MHVICFQTCLNNTLHKCTTILDLFVAYLDVLRQHRGQLARFWMTYINMVNILLGLLRCEREGNWNFHLAYIQRMIPWCFALGKVNYARYLPVYDAQMTQFEQECPALSFPTRLLLSLPPSLPSHPSSSLPSPLSRVQHTLLLN